MVSFLKFFFLGVIWDAIVALDIIFTAEKMALSASITTLILTIASFTMYSRIVGKGELRWRELVALSLGSACGTYFMIIYL